MVLYSPMEGKGPGPAKSLKHGILTLIFVAYLLHCGYCSVSNETGNHFINFINIAVIKL